MQLKSAIGFIVLFGVIATVENGMLRKMRGEEPSPFTIATRPVAQVTTQPATAALPGETQASSVNNAGISKSQISPAESPNQNQPTTIVLTTEWSKPVYLPDTRVQVVDFKGDIVEPDVICDVLVNGQYLYHGMTKGHPAAVTEAISFLQWRISANSPVKTGTIQYRITPR